MPKKNLGHRVSHFSSLDEKDLSKIFDLSLGESEQDDAELPVDEDDLIKTLHIKPAGYPIKPLDAPDQITLSINEDPKLFQAYAAEQWGGLSVRVNDFIFDQLLLPDFAFKVEKIVPKAAFRIGSDTKFKLIQEPPKKPKLSPVLFADIVGNRQAIEKAEIISEYLKDPEKFGDWAPKNILFHGPPGTGKTLTAKAIATASKCSFYAKKGTTLIGIHVGDGAAKIHRLFKDARAHAPAIIFIDELDSIGLNRSYQSVRGDVIEVATALLAELDGLDSHDGVITIGATNGLDLLDIGLRNRFEEEIEFPNPNEEERKAMLELFCKKVPIPIHADFGLLAKKTENWSGRALHEKLVKVAVHQAIREKRTEMATDLLLAIVNRVNKQTNTSGTSPSFFT